MQRVNEGRVSAKRGHHTGSCESKARRRGEDSHAIPKRGKPLAESSKKAAKTAPRSASRFWHFDRDRVDCRTLFVSRPVPTRTRQSIVVVNCSTRPGLHDLAKHGVAAIEGRLR